MWSDIRKSFDILISGRTTKVDIIRKGQTIDILESLSLICYRDVLHSSALNVFLFLLVDGQKK